MKAFALIFAVLLATQASGAVQTRVVEYTQNGTRCKGYLAYDDAVQARRPAVLIIPEWYGLNDYARGRARQLAELGYVALGADMYGDGFETTDRTEAGSRAGALRKDRSLMRARAQAALDALREQPQVDTNRIAAIGYCFGGGAVLELARSGADVAGAVSFHGNLDTPNPGDARNIKCKILVCHGADDPNVPVTQVTAFMEEMRSARVDWQLVAYGNAVHSFTNPDAGSDPSKGAAYNAEADRRSWADMRQFFAEIFAQ